jgi:signal transduction histidine kinase
MHYLKRYFSCGLLLLLSFLNAAAQPQSGHSYEYPLLLPAYADSSLVLDRIGKAKALAIPKPDTAVILLTDAFVTSKAIHFTRGIKSSLGVLLPVLDAKGDYPEKERLLQDAWTYCMNNRGTETLLTFIYTALGKGYQQQEKSDKAAAYYLMAMYAARKYSPKDLAATYSNYGALLSGISMTTGTSDERALYYLKEAVTLAAGTADYNVSITSLINLGGVYVYRKDYLKSLEAYEQALQLAQQHGFVQWQQVALVGIGNLHYEQKQAALALPYLQKAIALSGQGVDVFYRNAATVTLGKVYHMLGEYKRAEQLLLESLQLADKQAIGRDQIEARARLAGLYADMNLYQKAYEQHVLYAHWLDSLRSEEVTSNISQLEVKYRTAEQDRELLSRQLRINRQEQLIQQKNSYMRWIAAGCGALLLGFIGLYAYYRQRQKVIVGNKKLEEMKAMMQGEERERIRIAQELHDGIGGMLSAINMNLNVAEEAGFEDKKVLTQVMHMVIDTAAEVRKTAHNLMPAAMLRQNLPEAVRLYCDHLQSKGRLHIDVDINGDFGGLNPDFNTAIFRIIQELLQNVVKHAQASHAIVEMERTAEHLSLMVEDNGIGFDAEQQQHGFGLENMKLRVKTLGGSLSVTTQQGAGTAILIRFAGHTNTQHPIVDAKE